jgi:FKBP-type peptidyl-prolyl cis-trans isomerase FklB
MSVGSKYKFFVPYALGYGEKGAGNGAIPGFATLIFEVELLGIKPLIEAPKVEVKAVEAPKAVKPAKKKSSKK